MVNFVSLATNKYRFLGERLVARFAEYFRSPHRFVIGWDGNRPHKDWVTATNDKNSWMLAQPFHPDDQVFWIDADTNIARDVTADEILGETVAAQHFADQTWMRGKKGYDRDPRSSCRVPEDTPFAQMWFMGAFYGGRWSKLKPILETLEAMRAADKAINYEPGVNDESRLNWYFHYNPPQRTILWPNFPFLVSDKGGAECLRT